MTEYDIVEVTEEELLHIISFHPREEARINSCLIFTEDDGGFMLNQEEFEGLGDVLNMWPERWLILAQSRGELTLKLKIGRLTIDYQKNGCLLLHEHRKRGLLFSFEGFQKLCRSFWQAND